MATCSQCGKEVSLFDRDIITGACRECRKIGARPATLGCGTLILIGIVVALATQSGVDRVERRLANLEHSVDSLKAEVAQQTAEIRQLRKTIEESPKPNTSRNR